MATTETKAKRVLDFARKLQADNIGWMEAHNAIFGMGGIATELFTTPQDRTAFGSTDEFSEIWKIINTLKKNSSASEPKSSGKFNLRIPESLHTALKREAEEEGVSLNQLCLTKLAVFLKTAAR